MAKPDLISAWQTIDPATLSPKAQAAYAKLRAANLAAREAKAAFEDAARAGVTVPGGTRLVFAYNFGKLSTALAPVEDDKPKAGKPAMSLADYLARNG